MVYSGELGYQSETLRRYLEGIPGVDRMHPGENPAVWMLQQIGGGVSPNPERTEAVKPGMPLTTRVHTMHEGKRGAVCFIFFSKDVCLVFIFRRSLCFFFCFLKGVRFFSQNFAL